MTTHFVTAPIDHVYMPPKPSTCIDTCITRLKNRLQRRSDATTIDALIDALTFLETLTWELENEQITLAAREHDLDRSRAQAELHVIRRRVHELRGRAWDVQAYVQAADERGDAA